MSSKKKKATKSGEKGEKVASPRKEKEKASKKSKEEVKEELASPKKKKKSARKNKDEAAEASNNEEAKKKSGSKRKTQKVEKEEAPVSPKSPKEKKKKGKKKKKGSSKTKSSDTPKLSTGLSVAGAEGEELLQALEAKANEKLETPEDEEKQFKDFVNKLTNGEGDEEPGAPKEEEKSYRSADLDAINDSLKALEEWDTNLEQPKEAPPPAPTGDPVSSDLDALIEEMAQSFSNDDPKEKGQEAEQEKKRKEQEQEKEKEKEKEKEAEEKKRKEQQEREKEKEEEEKKKASGSPQELAGKFQAFKIEIEGVKKENNDTATKDKEEESESEDEGEDTLTIADRVRKEFIDTETTYVDGLGLIMKMYYRPLEISGLLRPKDIDTIFYGISQIHDIHSNLLVDLLDAEKKAATGGASAAFASVLQRFVPFLKIYTEYINHYDDANRRLHKLQHKEKKFAAFLKECQAKPECRSLDLASYLISPIQRLPRYELLLRDFLKHSQNEQERKQIEGLFNAVVEVNRYINQRKGDSELRKKKYKLQSILKQHKVDLFNRPDREFVKEGSLKICEIAERDPKDIIAGEGSMRITQSISSRKLGKKYFTPFKENYFFLFDDILIQVLAQTIEGETTYKYVRHYATSSISIESVTLNSPMVGVLLDPIDETANSMLLTWLTTEKSSDEDELFTGDAPASPSGRESSRLYMRRFYLKAAHPQEKNDWKEAIEKRAAYNVDGIIDNKIRRGTLKVPLTGLTLTPEEAAVYKEQMKKKYEAEQRMSMSRALEPHEADALLSTLESRVPVMDIFKGVESNNNNTHNNNTHNNRPKGETLDLKSQMAMLDKELASWDTNRKEGTWGKSTGVSPFSEAATQHNQQQRGSPRSYAASPPPPSQIGGSVSLGDSTSVNDAELEALLKSLDNEGIKDETARVQSTTSTHTPTTTTTRTTSTTSLSSLSSLQTSPSIEDLVGEEKVAALERLKREQEAKLLEIQREAERVRRELEVEKLREKEREQDRIEREVKEKFERMQMQEAMKRAGVDTLICASCFAPIGGAAYVRVGERAYHAEHFTCVVCSKGLAGQSYFPVGDEKKPHCSDCYNRLSVLSCHRCRQTITGEYMIVWGKNWHNDCLVCYTCGTQFSDARGDQSKRMMSKDDDPICKGCFGRTWNQGRKCNRCGQAVISTNEAKLSPTMDRCWHRECYVCVTCSVPLSEDHWRDNEPYCHLHY